MQEVIRLMLARLEADLATDEISVAMAAFNALAWLDRSQEGIQKQHVANLARVLGYPQQIAKDFIHVAKVLARLLQTYEQRRMSVSNKVAWSWVLMPQWRSKFLPKYIALPKEIEKIVFFYLSVKLNTTSLERNLGELCRQLTAHGGHGSEALQLPCWRWRWTGPRKKKNSLRESMQRARQNWCPPSLGGLVQSCGWNILVADLDTSMLRGRRLPRNNKLGQVHLSRSYRKERPQQTSWRRCQMFLLESPLFQVSRFHCQTGPVRAQQPSAAHGALVIRRTQTGRATLKPTPSGRQSDAWFLWDAGWLTFFGNQ